MPYQGLAFAIFLGIGIATATFLYFLDRQPENVHNRQIGLPEAPPSRTGWSNRQRCPPLEPTSGMQEENRQDRSCQTAYLHIQQHFSNVTINSHNGQLMLTCVHLLQTDALRVCTYLYMYNSICYIPHHDNIAEQEGLLHQMCSTILSAGDAALYRPELSI
uniref:Uncharacterized protein n=1 Tax=Timema monikensis TaxID=170555 RepID=A0A7R9HJ26_9NEOP|nr:unnamed protein product [Timema monikensis]